jgi:hypothetical protein
MIALLLLSLSGCAVDSAHIQITERPNTRETRRYQETFDEAYYDLSSSGVLRLVLRKRQPASLEGDELTQTIVVESVWRPIPGVTIAHGTQINGTVTYGLSGQRIVQNLTGAGSVFYYENDAGDRLTGTLGHVTLESVDPKTGDGFLQRVELSGISRPRDPRRPCTCERDRVKRVQQKCNVLRSSPGLTPPVYSPTRIR